MSLFVVFTAPEAGARPTGGEDRSQYRRGAPGTGHMTSSCDV